MTFSYRYIMILAGVLLMTFVSCKKDSDDSSNLSNDTPVQEPELDIIASVEHLGICYGPYHYDGQEPGKAIPKSQIEADLDLIAKHFDFFRTYTVADGMDKVAEVAKDKGLEVSVGVYCYPNDEASTKKDIDIAVMMAKNFPTTVTSIVVGNETNVQGKNYVKPTTVASYMDYAHSKMQQESVNLPLTSCITGNGATQKYTGSTDDYCGVIMQKCKDLNPPHHQIIYLTIYPYYGNGEPGNIDGNMFWSYHHGIQNAEDTLGLCVVIGEIGWPTAYNNNPADTTKRENIINQRTNFPVTLKWIDGNNFLKKAYNSYWFEMFDEPWKTDEPNGIAPFWGLYKKNGATKPNFPIPPLV
ncbi:hypothetical protein ACFLRY_00560 [Bacteroidota bacterium]